MRTLTCRKGGPPLGYRSCIVMFSKRCTEPPSKDMKFASCLLCHSDQTLSIIYQMILICEVEIIDQRGRGRGGLQRGASRTEDRWEPTSSRLCIPLVRWGDMFQPDRCRICQFIIKCITQYTASPTYPPTIKCTAECGPCEASELIYDMQTGSKASFT